MPVTADEEMRELLGLSPVAMIGATDASESSAHDVPAYLVERGVDIVPVNPNLEAGFGRTAYASLERVPDDCPLVTVFRPSEEVPGIVDVAIEREDVSAIWLQRGITHPEAVARAEQAGLLVVEDRCMRVEYDRLISPD